MHRNWADAIKLRADSPHAITNKNLILEVYKTASRGEIIDILELIGSVLLDHIR
jgi:hypothetical protein